MVRHLADLLVLDVEFLEFLVFAVEDLADAHARKILGQEGVEVADVASFLAEDLAHDFAENKRNHARDESKDQQIQRKANRNGHHDHQDADRHAEVLQ